MTANDSSNSPSEKDGGRHPRVAGTSRWRLLRPYLLDVAGPFVAYAIAHAFGVAGVWAMTTAGLAAGLSTAINTARRRKLDAVGVLVVLEIVTSIAVLVLVHDARVLLIRPSFYTGIAAFYIGASAFLEKPLSYAGSRMMVEGKGPERLAAFERAWDCSAEFRRLHRAVTLALGLCLAVDSLLRVVIVYHAPLARAAWLSNVPHVSAIALMMAISATAGRRFKRIVDGLMACEQHGADGGKSPG
ncbi:MAG TPA: VC0807 family protein [Opitutaceae bacterium]|nr:VC0807 family protein [Opitutaceae bacterium]